MSERKRLTFLVLIMTAVSFILIGINLSFLYNAAIEQGRERLVETAQSQARLIEAFAHFNALHIKEYSGESEVLTLAQIADAHHHYKGFGKTGEFTLARLVQDKIVFLLNHRYSDLDYPKPVPFESMIAEPMRRALLGRSGTMIGLDYRGKKVLAAYEPVSELNLGIVAKIDLAEIQEPFKRAVLVTFGFSVLAILGGVSLFFQITNPMIRHLENQASELTIANDMMKQEIGERIRIEDTLKWELAVNSSLSKMYEPLTSSSTSINGIANLILDNGRLLTGSMHGYVSSIDPLTCNNLGYTLTEMMKAQCNVSGDKKQIVFSRSEDGNYNGLWGHALNTKEAFFSNSPASHLSSKGVPEGHIRLERFLSVPVMLGKDLVGQISLANKDNDYTARDLEAIRRLAEYYSLAIQRKRAEEALHRTQQELERRVEERTAELSKSNASLKEEIEQRKQAEEQLQKNQDMLQMVFDGISDPLLLLDKDLNIKLLNISALEYYGLNKPQEVVGKRCHIGLQGKSNPCEGCLIPSTVLNKDKTTIERQGVNDPHRFEVVVVYPLQKISGEPGDIIVRISDVTKRKLFEKQLIQSEKMASLGILVSSIAHEINNPNTFISFNIPILRDYLVELFQMVDQYAASNPDFELFNMSYPEFRKDILNLVDNLENGSKRINSFVSNLREFSRIKYKNKEDWVDLNSVVEKALFICRNRISKTIKSIRTDIPAGFKQIYTDPDALEHILVNFLINAAQAADKKDSWVRISALVGDSWLDHTIIEVKDNGCGIDEKDIKYIFDPFFTTKIHAEGTGLGLYICNELITGLRGRIEVETKLGEYSKFRVILPDRERRGKSRA